MALGLGVLVDGRAGLRCVLQDVGEGLRVEAGAADEGAVDLGLGHEGGDVVGLDAAAVEDADVRGGVLAERSATARRMMRWASAICSGGRRCRCRWPRRARRR